MIQIDAALDFNAGHLVRFRTFPVSGELNNPGSVPIRGAYGT
jgi:hypothetical protein